MNIDYKVLSLPDMKDYKNIRLELLKLHPTHFGSSYEEESEFQDSHWEKRLTNPNATSIGAYHGDKIIGICVVVKNPRAKMKHKATLNSMYVSKEYRRKGVSNGLLSKAYTILKIDKVELLQLSVMSDNLPAIILYLKEGFIEEGRETKAIKLDNKYYDLVLMQKKL